MTDDQTKKMVRESYGKIAQSGGSCCGPSGCGCGTAGAMDEISRKVGYADEDLQAVPAGANLGLGCGNPIALASLKPGETVLDLGSGPGFDCFLAANRVGPEGRVIGVDMTAEMLARARENARQGQYTNVEFRLGEIEHLPVANGSIDVIISNCVINLAPDKGQVFREAFRVLRPGGRLMISDTVMLQPLPEPVQRSVGAYVGCLAGRDRQADLHRPGEGRRIRGRGDPRGEPCLARLHAERPGRRGDHGADGPAARDGRATRRVHRERQARRDETEITGISVRHTLFPISLRCPVTADTKDFNNT